MHDPLYPLIGVYHLQEPLTLNKDVLRKVTHRPSAAHLTWFCTNQRPARWGGLCPPRVEEKHDDSQLVVKKKGSDPYVPLQTAAGAAAAGGGAPARS